MPDRIHVPVEIPADSLGDFFTVSSMRVSMSFAAAELATAEQLGAAYTPHSVEHFKAFIAAQINEADAHGIGTCPWVLELSGCSERLEHEAARGAITPGWWLGQMRGFVEHLRSSLRSSGCPEARDLPAT